LPDVSLVRSSTTETADKWKQTQLSFISTCQNRV
jgi:hypothetical protein